MTDMLDYPRVIDALSVRQDIVGASQMLVVPLDPRRDAIVAARLAALDGHQLARRYGAFIQRWTRGLVQARLTSEGLRLYLTACGPCVLALTFRDAEKHLSGSAHVHATLSITGGLAVVGAADAGILVLRLEVRHGATSTDAALEAEVAVEHYAPRLLALPLPDVVRRVIYTTTQARLHRAITSAFIRDLVTAVVA